MEAMYPYFLIAHIICAIVFLGYIFADVILLSPVRKNIKKILSEEKQEVLDAVFGGISKRAIKIMPLCLLILILSGGAMISSYIGTEKGFFETKLQIILMIKAILALIILIMVCVSLGCKVLGVRNPLASTIHPLALILGFCIVVLAKVAFYFN